MKVGGLGVVFSIGILTCGQAAVHAANFADLVKTGELLLRQKQYPQAVLAFEQAVQQQPENGLAHLELGRALSRSGDDNRALVELFSALKLDMKLLEARAEVASILMKRGSFDEAGGQLKQILDQQPSDYTTRGNLGICYEQLGFINQAIDQFKIVLGQCPRDTVALYNLAVALELKGNMDESSSYYRKVIALAPKHSLAYTGLGKCLMAQKDYLGAIAAERQAIQCSPNNHWAYLTLGAALEATNAKADSVEAYKKAIQISPKDPACKAALAQLLNTKLATGTGTLIAR